MTPFSRIDVGRLKNKTILLDVDGTLLVDGGKDVSEERVAVVRAMARHNQVLLLSNAYDEGRLHTLAGFLGVEALSGGGKPRPSSIKTLGLIPRESFVVIGNQFLTDGLLALRCGFEYLRVPHLTAQSDTRVTRLRYALDDIAYRVAPLFRAVILFDMLRPFHWIKNFLVFAPLFFAGTQVVWPQLFATLMTFVTFCVASSVVYVVNDIIDRKRDRIHPVKRFRPISSGVMSLESALLTLFILLLSLPLLFLLVPAIAPVIILYIALSISYSLWLKHIEIIDILAVASGYVLRVVAGGLAASVAVSAWIILCVFALALFLVIGKRRAEVLNAVNRSVLKRYPLVSLDSMLVLSAATAIITYSIYAVIGSRKPLMVFSVVFVVGALLRLLNNILMGADAEYPETFVFRDRIILFLGVCWVIFVGSIYYLF